MIMRDGYLRDSLLYSISTPSGHNSSRSSPPRSSEELPLDQGRGSFDPLRFIAGDDPHVLSDLWLHSREHVQRQSNNPGSRHGARLMMTLNSDRRFMCM
jgi:hypothetical protein